MKSLLLALLLLHLPASASALDVGEFAKNAALKTTGVLLAFAVHEACHMATIKALGGRVSLGRYKWPAPTIYAHNIRGNAANRAVAISGNACTGILAEIIMGKGLHKTSHVAWGAVALHTVNAVSYAWSTSGDAQYWTSEGGNKNYWRAAHTIHSARVGYLLWDDWYKINRGVSIVNWRTHRVAGSGGEG